MDFKNTDIIFILDPKEIKVTPGTGTITLSPDFENPYNYASKKTLDYLKRTLGVTSIHELMKSQNTNPLKATNIPNLLHCGLIYRLDLIDFICKDMTVEHFTNLRLIIYLVSLMPRFGEPIADICTVIHKISPNYLRYLLYEYHLYGLDPIVLTDAEIYETFDNLRIPEKYEIYDQRYRRLQDLQNLRADILKILCSQLYGSTNLCTIITKTVQSNLERIIVSAMNYETLIQSLGMHPLKMQEYDFDADQYVTDNLIQYISCTDPTPSEVSDLYTAIEKGVLPAFLCRYSDDELIYNITGIFIFYESRADLIRKLILVCGNVPKFFIRVNETPTICYGNLHDYIQYTPSQLLKYFETPTGFWNQDKSIQFSITHIQELCEAGIYFKQFISLINFCKDKIKKLKNKN